MQVRKGGAWRSIRSASAFINGAWRPILYGKCYKSGAWRDVCNFTVAPPPSSNPPPASLTLSASPTSISAASNTSPMTTATTTATPSGGASPYSYRWSIVSSDGYSYTLTNPTGATTGVSVSNLPPGSSSSCSIRCTCSDSTGLSGTSNAVTASFTHTSASGGDMCVTAETPILMADGSEKPMAECAVGELVRTQHERTLEWGDYRIAALEFAEEPVFRADGLPRATAMHRFFIGGEWVHMKDLGEPDGTALVGKMTVEDAHTYVSAGVLSHNLKPIT